MEWDTELKLYPKYWHSRLKRGFGLGSKIDYHPWLRVRDVPSIGTSGNPKGLTIPRVYHLLSGLERIYFHLIDRQSDVIDIREQFPILDLKSTLAICAGLGVTHTRDGRFPEPFTLDFMVTRQTTNGPIYQARSIKTSESAKDPAVRLRLSVEYEWCKNNGIDWKLVNTGEFSNDMLATLTFVRGWSRHQFKPNEVRAAAFVRTFQSMYSTNVPLQEVVQTCAHRLKRSYRDCLNEFRYCAWTDQIAIDLTRKVSLHLPLVLRGKYDNA